MSIQFKRKKTASTKDVNNITLLSGQPLIDFKSEILYVGSTETDSTSSDKIIINAIKQDLYVNKPIGNYTAGTKISAGTTYDTIFANIFDKKKEVTEPNPIQPSISSFSLSFPINTDNEVGAKITSLKLNYSVSLNKGSYKLGTTYQDSGVTFSKVEFLHNGSVISSATVTNPSTSFSGTLTLSSGLTLTNTSQTVNITCRATHSAGSTPTNSEGVSKPNLAIASGTKTEVASVSKTGVYYPYYLSSPSVITSGASVNTSSYSELTRGSLDLVATSASDMSSTNATIATDNYLYIFAIDNKDYVIQLYNSALNIWKPLLSGTENIGAITLTTKQGNTATYYMYRTKKSQASTSMYRVRLIERSLVTA